MEEKYLASKVHAKLSHQYLTVHPLGWLTIVKKGLHCIVSYLLRATTWLSWESTCILPDWFDLLAWLYTNFDTFSWQRTTPRMTSSHFWAIALFLNFAFTKITISYGKWNFVNTCGNSAGNVKGRFREVRILVLRTRGRGQPDKVLGGGVGGERSNDDVTSSSVSRELL